MNFSPADIAQFSAASGDRNPLHLDPVYARSTPYGQPVVFGCLGALACLGELHLPEGEAIESLQAEFLRPIFSGVNYRIEARASGTEYRATILDGTVKLLTLKIKTRPAGSPSAGPVTPLFDLTEPVVRTQAEIVPGLTVSGRHTCGDGTRKLMARWGIQDRVVTSALCCASYVVGMHLPGLSALFTILHLDFAEAAENFAYKATVTGFDERFSEMEADFSLTAGATVTASGTFSAMVRPPQPEPETLATSATTELAGRVAIVTGSSRGLGAAIQQAFERRGAQVFGVSRSQSMDAGNAVDMRVLRDRVTSESGRLDYLVCNAFPPLHSLRIEPETATRIQSYIDAAVALTLTPMAELLPLLHKSGGTLVMISSSAVETPVKEWPHYVAAKQAVEALATAAALQYSGVSTVIVRPPKLLTTLTNTPMGRLDAKSPAAFADSLVRHLVEPGKEKVTIYPRE